VITGNRKLQGSVENSTTPHIKTCEVWWTFRRQLYYKFKLTGNRLQKEFEHLVKLQAINVIVSGAVCMGSVFCWTMNSSHISTMAGGYIAIPRTAIN